MTENCRWGLPGCAGSPTRGVVSGHASPNGLSTDRTITRREHIMLTTDYVPGAPNWIDLGSPDVEASAAFYGSLFGWSFQSAGPEAGGYGFFQLDGRTVAAAGPLVAEGAIPAWTVYFHTADADATTKAVEQAGGTVRFAPDDVFTAGRMAGFTDPGGAEFAVWQPGETKGLDLVTVPGSLAWTELYVPDPDAVRPFYQSVFDWRVQELPFDGITYIVVSAAEGESADQGGLMPLQEGDRPHWLPYFEVPDCDTTVALAGTLGGTVLVPAVDVADVGRFAVISDPNGARFAVITSAAAS
ncbi:VOC family protein [Streptosporangium carneum]|uniref:Hydroxylase n=1 Tax=Streptosporangium carneum TaxID=47481 RepID=A0A9W6MG74_9ACTN|nr:VOC family protein [Streptosporangium carneum]GLK13434.1 hydroxylase [Streptosporangium carneum]